MKLAELIDDLERRRAEAERHGYRAPAAKLYGAVLEDLRRVDGTPNRGRLMSTAEAGEVLGVSQKTVCRKIRDGQFPGARKTSENGEWRIPAPEVYERAGGAGESSEAEKPAPRLWSPDGDAR